MSKPQAVVAEPPREASCQLLEAPQLQPVRRSSQESDASSSTSSSSQFSQDFGSSNVHTIQADIPFVLDTVRPHLLLPINNSVL